MEQIVETSAGRVRGREDGGVLVFRGVPFGAPPTGARRLARPRPADPWGGVRDAFEFGPAAPQHTGILATLTGRLPEGSEDCLNLNVYTSGVTPRPDGSRRPVMVWIHGGGFTIGSGSQTIYDGSSLARRGDVVVVTINYRLGALGFLALPALAETGEGLGNQGLRDQLLALEWVRENAEAFGGDPRRITVFGESAGAMSVGTLLGTPRAAGLFQRAIPQSGAAHNASPVDRAVETAERLMKALGLGPDDLDGLRTKSPAEFLDAQLQVVRDRSAWQKGLPFQPTVDGDLLPRPPLEAIADGLARDVSLLTGTNLDEWKLFGLSDPRARDLDRAGLLRRCGRNLAHHDDAESLATELVETYEKARTPHRDTLPRELWFAIETDRIFRIPAVRLAEAQLAAGAPVYKYLFTWPSPLLDGALGACHALEIPFVFGMVEHSALGGFVGQGEAAVTLQSKMQDAWLAFAQSGDPETGTLGRWPRYDASQRESMLLGAEHGTEPDVQGIERRFWEGRL